MKTPVFDANATGGKDLGPVPDWDLTDLYAAPDAPEFKRDMDWLEDACARFAADYEGRLATLTAAASSPASCATRRSTPSRAGSCPTRACATTRTPPTPSAPSSWPTRRTGDRLHHAAGLLLARGQPDRGRGLAALLAENADLARYKPVFDRLRAMKPYQLSDELEKFLHDQSTVGAAAWNRLFDETMAGLTFPVDGEDPSLESTLNLLTDPDRPRREAGARALAEVFEKNLRLFARVHNTLAKEKEIEDRWRKMPTPQHAGTCRTMSSPRWCRRCATPSSPPTRLSHRYYDLKREVAGPRQAGGLGPQRAAADRIEPPVGWDDARATVMDAYAEFDPRMADLAEPFFDKGWIDAGVKPGKAPGAFAHPTVTDVHPYVMLNYLGKPRDVMTLAHELGHGVHQRSRRGRASFCPRPP
jgi:oligoendopeptidase F